MHEVLARMSIFSMRAQDCKTNLYSFPTTNLVFVAEELNTLTEFFNFISELIMEYTYPDGEEQRPLSDSFLIKQLEQYGNNIYFIFVPRNYEKLISRWNLLLLVL